MTRALEYTVRTAIDTDEPFLRQMLLLAAFPPGIVMPAPDEVYEDERLARYLTAWGRAGDAGVMAEADGAPIGAAWYRHFPPDAPGHGFVSEEVPEGSIAVAPTWRRRGVGRALLVALIERARNDGEPGLSLIVSSRNAVAMRLYESVGIRQLAGDADHPTMLMELAPPSDEAEER